MEANVAHLCFELVESYKRFIFEHAKRNKVSLSIARVELALIGVPEGSTYKFVVALRPVDANFTVLWNYVVNSTARESVEGCLADLVSYVNDKWKQLQRG